MPSIKDKRVSATRSICEVHRELHDILMSEKSIPNDVADQMITLLEEAYIMAKKMNNKLRQYKFNYDDGWWEQSNDELIKEKLKRRNVNKTVSQVKHNLSKGDKR